jgi:hypothetical protein
MQIALRTLTYLEHDQAIQIQISISAPVQAEGPWFCEWSIDWPHGMRASRAYGVDGVQALRLTLEMIGTELYSSPYHATGHLYFEKPGDGYGFPVPSNLRDLLIGQDRLSF